MSTEIKGTISDPFSLHPHSENFLHITAKKKLHQRESKLRELLLEMVEKASLKDRIVLTHNRTSGNKLKLIELPIRKNQKDL